MVSVLIGILITKFSYLEEKNVFFLRGTDKLLVLVNHKLHKTLILGIHTPTKGDISVHLCASTGTDYAHDVLPHLYLKSHIDVFEGRALIHIQRVFGRLRLLGVFIR